MTVVVTHTTPADGTFSATGAAAWNADHALAGVGTMAEQDANAVAITGGNINNTVIGNTTPNAATFTTLTATGQTDLGGTASTKAVRIETQTSTGQHILFSRFDAGNTQKITAAGIANMALQSTGGGFISLRTADGSEEQARITRTASAVNYVQVTGAATNNRPTASSQGSDTDIGFNIVTKGSGTHNFASDANIGTSQFQVTRTQASAVNYLTATGAATNFSPRLFAAGSDTNIPLVLQPKGTGALQAQLNDGTATGGNARGANAVDWQTNRDIASRVASGSFAFIGGGRSNTCTGFNAVIGGGGFNNSTAQASFVGAGEVNTASGLFSSVVGGQSNTSAGYYNFVGGGFTNSGTANGAVTTQSGTMNGTTAVTLSGSNASIRVGQIITGTSIAGDTYVAAISGTSLTLSKAASGSSTSTLSFFTPHGVVVGGGNNQATGAYSFIGGGGDAGTAANRNVASGDWSTVGGGTRQLASAPFSFIGGGYGNTTSTGYGAVICGGGFYGNLPTQFSGNSASGSSAFVGAGFSNIASGFGSFVGSGNTNYANSIYGVVVGGYNGNTRGIQGLHAFPANNVALGTQQGCSQASLLIIGKQTTDATPSVLTCDPNAAGTTNQVILPNNAAYFFRGEVVSGVTGGGNTKGWTIEGVIKRGANAASTALVGTPTVTSSYADAGASSWVIAVTADTTNGGLAVTFTGQAGTTIRTVCQLFTTEMTF